MSPYFLSSRSQRTVYMCVCICMCARALCMCMCVVKHKLYYIFTMIFILSRASESSLIQSSHSFARAFTPWSSPLLLNCTTFERKPLLRHGKLDISVVPELFHFPPQTVAANSSSYTSFFFSLYASHYAVMEI